MRFVCQLFCNDIVLVNNVDTDYVFSLLFVSFIQVYTSLSGLRTKYISSAGADFN
jgi:hypothetical protein